MRVTVSLPRVIAVLEHRLWLKLHDRPWWWRALIKTAFVVAVTFLVLYPYPGRFLRQIHNLRHLDTLANPDDPAIAKLSARFDAYLARQRVVAKAAHAPTARTHPAGVPLEAIQQFVEKVVPYACDWQSWGVVDYTPSADEVLARGQEDCDGRAVVAAALLRYRGIDARLVGDFRHMWVWTPLGETMTPLGAPAFEIHDDHVRIDWEKVLTPGPLVFGIAVFPFARELIILGAIWLVLLRPGLPGWRGGLGFALMIEALVVLRVAGVDPLRPHPFGMIWAFAHVVLAVAVMIWPGRRLPTRTLEAEPGMSD